MTFTTWQRLHRRHSFICPFVGFWLAFKQQTCVVETPPTVHEKGKQRENRAKSLK